jgi:sulfate transport system permease protein
MNHIRRRRGVLPGFGLTLGFTVFYMSLIVLLPLAALVGEASALRWDQFWSIVSEPRVVAAYKLTLLTSLAAALINVCFGLIVAWVLVRYRFPGRRLLDAIIDIPFALPTAVAGIALTTIYAPNGWAGSLLLKLGIQAAYSPLGIIIALIFIGLPFVVRTVQPVLTQLDQELEEAAASLGAGRFRTLRQIILPEALPALTTGFSLALARALGEYGSVVFISGNMPGRTEVVSLLIMTKLEQFDYAGATAIGTILLAMSFVLLLTINLLQWRASRKRST